MPGEEPRGASRALRSHRARLRRRRGAVSVRGRRPRRHQGGLPIKFRVFADNPELVRANLERAEAGKAALKSYETDSPGVKPEVPVTARRPTGSTLGTLPSVSATRFDAIIAKTHPGFFAEKGFSAGRKGTKKSEKKSEEKSATSSSSLSSSLPAAAGMTAEEFKRLMNLRYLSSLAAPGEALGCVAAQSVGEPSTQMTLNTFHFAGRGEANVTLGIPRLRELLMAAAKKLATPVMTLPLKLPRARTTEAAQNLARRLRRIRMAELVKTLVVSENACGRSHGGRRARPRVHRQGTISRIERRGGRRRRDGRRGGGGGGRRAGEDTGKVSVRAWRARSSAISPRRCTARFARNCVAAVLPAGRSTPGARRAPAGVDRAVAGRARRRTRRRRAAPNEEEKIGGGGGETRGGRGRRQRRRRRRRRGRGGRQDRRPPRRARGRRRGVHREGKSGARGEDVQGEGCSHGGFRRRGGV